MASPLTIKAKWPSQKRKIGDTATDFVPYVSNLANMFRKVPQPRAPKLVDPITGTRISMADTRRQVSDQTQAADLATQNLDAQTGAAIRVGNMGNKFRALSDINSKEAQINAQQTNQTRYINANIDAQNAATTNAYQDDLTNAAIAQQRVQSENLSNAADKFIGQQAVKDQVQLEKDKATILSKQYNPGVYSRFLGSLQNSGMETGNYGVPGATDDFAKYRSMSLPPLKGQDLNLDTTLPTQTLNSMKKYMSLRKTYAAGGMMKVYSEDPKPKTVPANTGYGANYGIDPMTRKSNFIDGMTHLVGNGLDPFTSSEGKSFIGGEAKTFYNPEFAMQLGTRIKAFQANPDYIRMSPQQRVQKFYEQRNAGTPVDQFLTETAHFSGNPGANYMNNPLSRAAGGPLKPSIVKDSENRARWGRGRVKYLSTARDRDATEFTQPMDVVEVMDNYTANIPQPGYQSMNLNVPTNFSATYRDEAAPSKQRTIYFPNKEQWKGFLGTGALGGVDTKETFNQASATGYRAFSSGGSIHIKPENRGKFTAAANQAGMGVQEYAAHVLADEDASPTLRKRANFARNAARWNHAYGGKIKPFY